VAWELGAMPTAETLKLYEPHKTTISTPAGEQEFQYRLMRPEKIEAGKKYPVVLFLHGAGERGSDNQAQLAYLPEWLARSESRKEYPCFLIAPQCPENQKWADTDWSAKESIPRGKITPALQAAVDALDELLETAPADPKRIYLTGLSMGGYGSWDLAARTPERFAAVAPICGGGDEHDAARLVDVPIWAWHGEADTAVPVERSRRMIEAIRAAGGHPKLMELAGVGHNSWTPAYTEREGVVPWMFEQVKKSAPAKP
jgi:predicted peptidase